MRINLSYVQFGFIVVLAVFLGAVLSRPCYLVDAVREFKRGAQKKEKE